MYASIFSESEWKAPIQKFYRSAGCSSCGLGRYYSKESFREFRFEPSIDVEAVVPVVQTPVPTLSQVSMEDIEKKVEELRRLPVKQLVQVLGPVVPADLGEKYKRMFPKSLQRLIESFSTKEIAQAIVTYLPQESIMSLVSLQVPAPLQLQKRAVEKVLKVNIDQSFYNSLLFTEYSQIPKNDPNFSYMDPTFAIGNANSSYTPFNIIVNLDFPYNGVEKNSVQTEMTSDKKLIIRVGIYDSPEEPMLEVIETLVPFLNTLVKYHANQPRILFHCRAGISRSVSIALAYYGKLMRYDLTRAYSQLAARRSIIRPNPGFIEAIEEFLI